jgi:hypothetical protein
MLDPSSDNPYALAQGDPRFSCLSVNSSSAKAHSVSKVACILSQEDRGHHGISQTTWNNHYAVTSQRWAFTLSPTEELHWFWAWIISEVTISEVWRSRGKSAAERNLEKHATSEIKYQQQKQGSLSVNTTWGKNILPGTLLPRGRQTIFFSHCLGTHKTCYLNAAGDPNAETCNQKSIHKIKFQFKIGHSDMFVHQALSGALPSRFRNTSDAVCLRSLLPNRTSKAGNSN